MQRDQHNYTTPGMQEAASCAGRGLRNSMPPRYEIGAGVDQAARTAARSFSSSSLSLSLSHDNAVADASISLEPKPHSPGAPCVCTAAAIVAAMSEMRAIIVPISP